MGRAFEVTVVDQRGQSKVKTAITGGGDMTAEELGEHYERFNHFPGAKSITIREMEGRVPEKLHELLRQRSQVAKQLRPLTTPKATVVPEKYIPPGFEEAVKLPPHPGTFAAVQAQRTQPVPPDTTVNQPQPPGTEQGGSGASSPPQGRPGK